jgi:hypothetical protein
MEPGPWDHILWDAIMRSPENALDIMRGALASGANISGEIPELWGSDERFEWGLTPLPAAVSFKEIDMVRILIDAGAKAKDGAELDQLFTRSAWNNDAEMLSYLFNRGVLDELTSYNVYSRVEEIVRVGTPGSRDVLCVCINHMVASGTPLPELLAYRGWNNNTLLHLAAKSWHRENRAPLVQLLIDFGANVLLTNTDGYTPADLATLVVERDPLVDAILETERLRILKGEAFVMGNHPRLGAGSMMSRLDPEVLRMIWEGERSLPHYRPTWARQPMA